MVQDSASVLILSYPGDELSVVVTANLEAKGTRALQIVPGTLTSRQISLKGDLLYLNGLQIYGMLFRVSPDSKFSDGYQINDQPFCDAEMRAILLAALNLDSILAVNKYDAVSWFEGLGWPTWRRKLTGAGIPVSEFIFGDSVSQVPRAWYPYASWQAMPAPDYHARRTLGSALTENLTVQHSLILGTDVVAGRESPSICATAELLVDLGVYIAEIVSDIDDKIVTVNTLPTVTDAYTQQLAGQQIAEIFHAHLHRR